MDITANKIYRILRTEYSGGVKLTELIANLGRADLGLLRDGGLDKMLAEIKQDGRMGVLDYGWPMGDEASQDLSHAAPLDDIEDKAETFREKIFIYIKLPGA